MLEIGSVLDGKYKILNKVGQGDMSSVYLAMDETENKQWAIKVFPKEGIRDQEVMTQSLVVEAEVLKTFEHPNLVKIVDVIEDEEKFLIVMDYIQGTSLLHTLEKRGAIPQEQVVEWAKQICDALHYLHTKTPAIFHRNVKPVNIMLKPDGSIILIDFASVREFKDKSVENARWLATAGYAAPEQFGHEGTVTAATDIYGLGATMYQLLTGVNPCKPPYKIERPIRIFDENLSEGLEKIVSKCTSQVQTERYQSMTELMEDLEHYNEVDEVRKQKQLHRVKVFAACVLACLVSTGIAAFCYHAADSRRIEEYDSLLKKATSSEGFYEAILADPTRADGYIELNEFLVQDKTLHQEEGKKLLKLQTGLEDKKRFGGVETVDVLQEFRDKNYIEYQDVCYQIGESFMFYYETNLNRERYQEARWWFAQASGKYAIANVYCEVSDCQKAIAQYSQNGQTEKLNEEYKLLWEKLKSLNICTGAFTYEEIEKKIHVWNLITSNIDENLEGLLSQKGANEIHELLNEIIEASSYVNSAELRDQVELLQDSIRTVKGTIDKLVKEKRE
jgi:serine/threonine-protein kinase